MEEMEKMFAKKGTGSSGQKKTQRTTSQKQRVALLSGERTKNIEIMLASIKLPHTDVAAALKIYNKENRLTTEQLEKLGTFVPTQEELKTLQSYTGSVTALSKAEKYFLVMTDVPRFKYCIDVAIVRQTFEADIESVQKSCELLLLACEQVKNSEMLSKVLEYVLALGNHLNRGTNRQAFGFKLDSLLKFMETKASDGQTTLLHFLVATILKKSPGLVQFPTQITACKLASTMKLDSLRASFSQLTQKMLQAECEVAHASPQAELGHFVQAAQQQLAGLEAVFEKMSYAVEEVAIYFGENPTKCQLEEPFKALVTFSEAFTRATLENETKEKAKADAARRKEEALKRKAMRASTS